MKGIGEMFMLLPLVVNFGTRDVTTGEGQGADLPPKLYNFVNQNLYTDKL